MVGVKTQISIVIENRPGVLTKICDVLASHQINIEGFSAYGEREHGIVRLVTSNASRAAEILANAGFLVTRSDILAVKLANRPAGLMRLARQLADNRINIEYSYGSAASAGRMATVFLRVANPERAAQVLSNPAAGKKRGRTTTTTTPAPAPAATRKKSARRQLAVRRRPAARGRR